MSNHNIHFTVDTQLLDELGKRLVSEDHIAVAELIKNAYDADATRVDVHFHKLRGAHHQQTITISDNGSGMTFADIETRWMRVATRDKLANPISDRFGRPRTGSKGIGRFAVLRISERLGLIAIGKASKGRLERTSIDFDWGRLKGGAALNSLQFVAEVTTPPDSTTGLRLVFRKLTKKWTGFDVLKLKRDLADLVGNVAANRGPPFEPDPGIDVFITSDTDDSEASAPLSEELLDSGWGRLRAGAILNGSHWELRLRAKHIGEVEHKLPIPTSLRPLQGRFRLDLAWYPGKAALWSNRAVATTKTVDEFLRHRFGVKVYLNGNRVFPYGERGDDWLRLEHVQASRITSFATTELTELAIKLNVAQHRPMLDHPRSQRLIGKVEIEQGPTGPLTPTTDRMGFVEDQAFSDLRFLVQQAIQWMTLHYTRAKLRASQQRARASGRKTSDGANADSVATDDTLRVITGALGAGNSAVTLSAEESSQVLESARSLASQAEAGAIRNEMLEQMASTATLLFVFSHEVHAILRTAAVASSALAESSKHAESQAGKARLREASDSLDAMTRGLRGLVGLVGLIARGARDDTARAQSVSAAVDRTVQVFVVLSERYKVKIETAVAEGLTTSPMRPGALASVLVNCLSNAFKAVLAGGSDRRVRIEASRDAAGLRIAILDSGIGLHRQHWDVVFEPLVSDPAKELYSRLDRVVEDPDLQEFAHGTGLGLGIVRSIVNRANGGVRFVPPRRSWSTCLEIRLP